MAHSKRSNCSSLRASSALSLYRIRSAKQIWVEVAVAVQRGEGKQVVKIVTPAVVRPKQQQLQQQEKRHSNWLGGGASSFATLPLCQISLSFQLAALYVGGGGRRLQFRFRFSFSCSTDNFHNKLWLNWVISRCFALATPTRGSTQQHMRRSSRDITIVWQINTSSHLFIIMWPGWGGRSQMISHINFSRTKWAT